jgi:sugar phosphate permease
MGIELGVSQPAGDDTAGTGSGRYESLPVGGETAAKRMLRVRWWVWSILALCYFMVFFQRIAPAVVADRLMADFAVGGAALGVLTSIYFWVYAAMQIPSGALADSLGVRRTVALGALLAGVGSLVFGLAPALELAYAGRFLVGLGVSVVFVATMKFHGSWYRPREFGTVSGLLIFTGNLGAVVGTTPVAFLSQTLGWRLSFGIVGVATLALAAATWRWVRDNPIEMGLPSLREIDRVAKPAGASGGTPPVKMSFRTGAGIVWRNRQTWAGLAVVFGFLGTYLTFSGLWAVPYLMHVYGMDRLEAANYLLVLSVGMLVSAPLMGYVSDRLQLRKPLVVGLCLLGFAVWVTMYLWNDGRPPMWALYPLFGAFGFAAGVISLVLTCVQEANPPALSGLAVGTANNSFLCAAILQPAIGYILDSYWQGTVQAGARVYPVAGYQVALAILAGFALVGLMGALMMKETHCRNTAADLPS